MLLCVPIESLKIVNPSDVELDVSENAFIEDLGFGNIELSAAEFETMKKNFKPKENNMHIEKVMGQKKPVVFIHVHKSLGTWACAAVRHAGGAAPKGADCCIRDDTPWTQKDFSFFDNENTCDAR